DMKREFQELQARRGPWEELHSPASGNRVWLHTTSNLIVRDIPQEATQRLPQLVLWPALLNLRRGPQDSRVLHPRRLRPRQRTAPRVPRAPVDPRVYAQLSTWDEVKSAHTAWLAKAHEAVGNKRAVKLVLAFATQCHSEVDMHNVMPAVEVTWSLSPKQTMMFQLVNRGPGRVFVRACRTVISEHIEELLYLFGPVQSVVPSVPEPRAELVSAAAPARLSARQALGAPGSAAVAAFAAAPA
ncbi:unnamed protein product, partial [Prorocentrum cordatum]